jgi:hypothetical protein
VPGPQYVHAKSPRPLRHRCLWVALTSLAMAGIGAAVATPPDNRMSYAAGGPAGEIAPAETIPTASPVRFMGEDQKVVNGAQGVTDKPFCVGGNDDTCVSLQLPKVRMVRVPRVTNVGQQELAKSGVASPARSPGLDKGNSEPKKAQKSMQRRNPTSAGPAARRNARAAGWKARGYASMDRVEHARQGVAGNFW